MPQYDVVARGAKLWLVCDPRENHEVGSAHGLQGKPRAGLAGSLSNPYPNPVTGYPVTVCY